MTALVASYVHPEYFPPTLNAIGQLSRTFEHVVVLTRRVKKSDWTYPKNVRLIELGPLLDIKQAEALSTKTKVKHFLSFCGALRRLLRDDRPDVTLVYETVTLFAHALARKSMLRAPGVVWYHNHDVSVLAWLRKFSIGWWATRFEPRAFQWLDMFSLPALERKEHFPLDRYKGAFFYIPNYPSVEFFKSFRQDRSTGPGSSVRLIYQGRICAEHGLEELIPLLGEGTLTGRTLELTIIGFSDEGYKAGLKRLAAASGVSQHFHVLDPVSYAELPKITRHHHIGWAVHPPGGIYDTGGSASNKTYEYMALGMPVLLFDSPHYRGHLGAEKWTFFTDGSREGTAAAIESIVENYESVCREALQAFEERMNFRAVFSPALEYFLSLRRSKTRTTDGSGVSGVTLVLRS